MADYIIRDAHPEDAPFLAKCIMAGMHFYDFETDISEETRIYERLIECERRDDLLYSYRYTRIAEKDGIPVGSLLSYPGDIYQELRHKTFGELWPDLAQMDAESEMETGPGEFYLDSLAVLPQYRCLGIGRALLMDGMVTGDRFGDILMSDYVLIVLVPASGDCDHLGITHPKAGTYRCGSTSTSENQCFFPFRRKTGFSEQCLKTVCIGIVPQNASIRTTQQRIHAPDHCRQLCQFVTERNHSLLIRDGHVQSMPVPFPDKGLDFLRLFFIQHIFIVSQFRMDPGRIAVPQLLPQQAAFHSDHLTVTAEVLILLTDIAEFSHQLDEFR